MGSRRTTSFPTTDTQLTSLSLTGKAKWRKPKLITAGYGSALWWERAQLSVTALWWVAGLGKSEVTAQYLPPCMLSLDLVIGGLFAVSPLVVLAGCSVGATNDCWEPLPSAIIHHAYTSPPLPTHTHTHTHTHLHYQLLGLVFHNDVIVQRSKVILLGQEMLVL